MFIERTIVIDCLFISFRFCTQKTPSNSSPPYKIYQNKIQYEVSEEYANIIYIPAEFHLESLISWADLSLL